MKVVSRDIFMMGTKIVISLVDERADYLLDKVHKMLEEYNQRFSANDKSSELMQINLAAGQENIEVHPELYELIELGKLHSMAEDSMLNIAIGPLTQAWRIGFSDARVLKNKEVNLLLQKTDSKNILLDKVNSSVYLAKKGMQIDLGALAKGYIADKLANYLRKEQVKSALINLGGNLLTVGSSFSTGKDWIIGIQNPKGSREESLLQVIVRDKSVVTSGIYERQLIKDGVVYHHIINPKTGYPVDTEIVSLTIIADLSVDAEIWTTRLFGHTVSEIIAVANVLPGIDCVILTQSGEVYLSDGIKINKTIEGEF